MANAKANKEKKQKIALGILFLLMIGVLVYQFVFNTPEPRKRTTAQGNTNNAATPSRSPAPAQPAQSQANETALLTPDAAFEQLLADTSPLRPVSLTSGSAAVSPRGNIFAYYVPPPPPPRQPDPPPPIALQFLQPQSAVGGTPRKFTLTVTGRNFPADPQILFNGNPKPTKRVSENSLSTEVAPQEYPSQGNINIEVKSISDPTKMYSNSISFLIQAPPDPPFKYIGRFGEMALLELNSSKEVRRLKVGEMMLNVWRVDTISDARIELTHTQYDIKRSIAMQDKGR